MEDNDVCFWVVVNGCFSVGEEGGKGYYMEEKVLVWYVESDGLFEIKLEMDRVIGLDFVLDCLCLQVCVLVDNDDLMRVLYGNKVEIRS